jgi:hypothetical protein
MAILRAAATADDTLDSTSYTLVDGLTHTTPASDDYLAYATIEILVGSTGTNDQLTRFAVFVGGTEVPHSEVGYEEDGSVNNCLMTMVLACKVSPNGSQDVDIRHIADSASTPLTAQRRELVLFPITGTVIEKTATADDSTTSTSYATVDGMTDTPASGTYFLIFTTSAWCDAAQEITYRVSVGGTPLAHTDRKFDWETSDVDRDYPQQVVCKVTPNGSQAVLIEWAKTAAGAAAITCHERCMVLVPVAAGDIKEAFGTAADSDSQQTDVQVDDMLIADPGANDWLVAFTAYDFYPNIAGNKAETVYSIRSAGTRVTDSERMNEHEGSLDSVNRHAFCGGRVTVAGGTDDVQIYWQDDIVNPPTRTIYARTVTMIREPSAPPVTGPAMQAMRVVGPPLN